MNTIFEPHGEFKLYVSNNIIIARLKGSWNKECAENFSEEFKANITSMKIKNWGHLVFLDDFELSVPKILPVVTDLVTFCINNGLEKSAQVYTESMMIKKHVDKMVVEKNGNFERRVFTDQDDAIKWLNQGGFSLTEGVVANTVV